MREYRWMTLEAVKNAVPAMEAEDVSEVARGAKNSTVTKEGFIEAYRATGGSPAKMRTRRATTNTSWAKRRQDFINRHMKQLRKNKEPLFREGGIPTPRHLGLIAWAYTPPEAVARLRKWYDAGAPSWSTKSRRNGAPGYRSYCWTQEDWRSIKVSNKGKIDYSQKCGAKGTQTESGKPRLCLPRVIIEALIKDHPDILRAQARKKARAAKGERVPWHPVIKEMHKEMLPECKDRRHNPQQTALLTPLPHVIPVSDESRQLLAQIGRADKSGRQVQVAGGVMDIAQPLIRLRYVEVTRRYSPSETVHGAGALDLKLTRKGRDTLRRAQDEREAQAAQQQTSLF